MAAPTEYYVNTVLGSNAGTSLVGDPWQTFKHAIETVITRDTTNGSIIKVHAPFGTPDVYTTGDPAIDLCRLRTLDDTNYHPMTIQGIDSEGSPAMAWFRCPGRYLVNCANFIYGRWLNVCVVGGSAAGIFKVGHNSLMRDCFFDNYAGGKGPEIDGTLPDWAFCNCLGTTKKGCYDHQGRQIKTTMNYELFRGTEKESPEVLLVNHGWLRELMAVYGFLPCFPLVCQRSNDGGQLHLRNGRHRLALAKQLGLPVHYVEYAAEQGC